MQLSTLFTTLASLAIASAHIVLVYPGTRGNNLITNETYPFGMQWMYPCGGLGTSRNRTYWPTTGGAVSFQPGWFQGHQTAFLHINIGFGTDGPDHGPPNMSNVMQPIWQLRGPTRNPYPGTICMPQVPLPAGADVKVGDKATIQVVELAVHGASLYSCVDIEFAEPGDPKIAEVNESNCFNSVDIGTADVYTIVTRESGEVNGTTSGADANSVTFWYFGRHRAAPMWQYLFTWAPAVLGGMYMFL
ncbi:hypothetical protein MKZ38_007501 [Zalerion maritima]|uniref:Copper acquisition factor BIM1-like domain-containing protein n=1 Tax=Zalerion maritima TaxID=339359 RepID=A0AAD5RIH3_9PEZI|nr:hypothetical protein MKZ38_007501 [Zalerion maritima]